MLTIARTLMGNVDLLLLDEPSEGLAPIVVASLIDKIRELKATGLSIVLAEQSLDVVLSLSDPCYVLERGPSFSRGRQTPSEAIQRYWKGFFRSDSFLINRAIGWQLPVPTGQSLYSSEYNVGVGDITWLVRAIGPPKTVLESRI